LIKREQDLYLPFKNRTLENNWGGKSGARNAWVSSLKENGHRFEAVRDGLLTLEEALFELSGGFGSPKPNSESLFESPANGKSESEPLAPTNPDVLMTNGDSSFGNVTTTVSATNSTKLTGKDLYYDEVSRFDIELESLGNDVHGLWNSPDTREIFREIVLTSNTVSVLALGLDLMCRNGHAYINRTKSSVVANANSSADNSTTNFVGRRRAATMKPGAYSDFF
jgi:hypothetical protein